MLARVYTTDSSGGTYGVMLEAPTDIDAAEEEASVYGLRSAAGVDRSNLAVIHVPGLRSSDPITLSVQVFSADGTPAPNVLARTLAPGEFFQWNDVLLLAGLPQGSSGYARISRVAGIGAWTGYGVVNDAATSDGSILPLYRPGGLAAARRLSSDRSRHVWRGRVALHDRADARERLGAAIDSLAPLSRRSRLRSPVAARAVALPVGAGRQVTLPDVVAFLRAQGVAIPELPAAGSQAGTLEVAFQGLDGDDAARTVALARTTTPNPNRTRGAASASRIPRSRGAAARGRRRLFPRCRRTRPAARTSPSSMPAAGPKARSRSPSSSATRTRASTWEARSSSP